MGSGGGKGWLDDGGVLMGVMGRARVEAVGGGVGCPARAGSDPWVALGKGAQCSSTRRGGGSVADRSTRDTVSSNLTLWEAGREGC